VTIVACDGMLIASDSLIVAGSDALQFDQRPKFGRARGRAVVWAAAGDTIWCEQFRRWACGERKSRPAELAEGSHAVGVIYDGMAWLEYAHNRRDPYVQGEKWTLGSGSRAGQSALILGLSPLAAVYAAARLDTSCGFPLYVATVSDLVANGDAAVHRLTQQQAAEMVQSEQASPL
jgi:hypothetical protein